MSLLQNITNVNWEMKERGLWGKAGTREEDDFLSDGHASCNCSHWPKLPEFAWPFQDGRQTNVLNLPVVLVATGATDLTVRLERTLPTQHWLCHHDFFVKPVYDLPGFWLSALCILWFLSQTYLACHALIFASCFLYLCYWFINWISALHTYHAWVSLHVSGCVVQEK